MSIEVTLSGLVFEIPTRGERDWGDLTNWILEVNEILFNSSNSFLIPSGEANLVNGSAVNLYTVNDPSLNSHIIFEYGISRVQVTGSESRFETGQMMLTYNQSLGTWETAITAVGNASVAVTISGANAIQATATALVGTAVTSIIYYRGRIIRT